MRVSKMLRSMLLTLRDPKFQADTCSMIVFSWIVGMGLELGVAHMTIQQSLQTRLVGMIANLLTGGLNGKWLDIVRSRLHAESNFAFSFTADVVAFLTFQALLYVLNLAATGATQDQILKAVGGAAIVCGIAGKPYGWFTDLFRWLFRVQMVVDTGINQDARDADTT